MRGVQAAARALGPEPSGLCLGKEHGGGRVTSGRGQGSRGPGPGPSSLVLAVRSHPGAPGPEPWRQPGSCAPVLPCGGSQWKGAPLPDPAGPGRCSGPGLPSVGDPPSPSPAGGAASGLLSHQWAHKPASPDRAPGSCQALLASAFQPHPWGPSCADRQAWEGLGLRAATWDRMAVKWDDPGQDVVVPSPSACPPPPDRP